ncbi:MAG: putative rane protein [Herbinix sp.]|nr:putative rane protein [Herbinix sp.]
MIKDNQKMFNRLHIVMDAAIIIIAYLLTFYFRFESFLNQISVFRLAPSEKYLTLDVYASRLIVLVPLYLFVYYYTNLYTPKRVKHRWTEIFNIIIANFFGIAFFTAYLFFIQQKDYSRGFVILFFLLNIFISDIGRLWTCM